MSYIVSDEEGTALSPAEYWRKREAEGHSVYNNAPQQPQQSPAPSKLNKFFGSVSKMVKDAVAGPQDNVQISQPQSFKHESHVQIDKQEGVKSFNPPSQWQQFLQKLDQQMRDQRGKGLTKKEARRAVQQLEDMNVQQTPVGYAAKMQIPQSSPYTTSNRAFSHRPTVQSGARPPPLQRETYHASSATNLSRSRLSTTIKVGRPLPVPVAVGGAHMPDRSGRAYIPPPLPRDDDETLPVRAPPPPPLSSEPLMSPSAVAEQERRKRSSGWRAARKSADLSRTGWKVGADKATSPPRHFDMDHDDNIPLPTRDVPLPPSQQSGVHDSFSTDRGDHAAFREQQLREESEARVAQVRARYQSTVQDLQRRLELERANRIRAEKELEAKAAAVADCRASFGREELQLQLESARQSMMKRLNAVNSQLDEAQKKNREMESRTRQLEAELRESHAKLENSSRLAMGQKAHSAAVGGTQKDLMQELNQLRGMLAGERRAKENAEEDLARVLKEVQSLRKTLLEERKHNAGAEGSSKEQMNAHLQELRQTMMKDVENYKQKYAEEAAKRFEAEERYQDIAHQLQVSRDDERTSHKSSVRQDRLEQSLKEREAALRSLRDDLAEARLRKQQLETEASEWRMKCVDAEDARKDAMTTIMTLQMQLCDTTERQEKKGHADRSEVTRLQEELTAQIRINSRLEETIRFLMSSVEKDSSRSRSIVEMQSISEEREGSAAEIESLKMRLEGEAALRIRAEGEVSDLERVLNDIREQNRIEGAERDRRLDEQQDRFDRELTNLKQRAEADLTEYKRQFEAEAQKRSDLEQQLLGLEGVTPRTHDDNAELRRRLHDAEEKLVESDLKCSNLSLELGEMKLKLGNAEPADLEHMEMQDLKGRVQTLEERLAESERDRINLETARIALESTVEMLQAKGLEPNEYSDSRHYDEKLAEEKQRWFDELSDMSDRLQKATTAQRAAEAKAMQAEVRLEEVELMTNRRDNFYDEEMASMNERKDKQLQAAQEDLSRARARIAQLEAALRSHVHKYNSMEPSCTETFSPPPETVPDGSTSVPPPAPPQPNASIPRPPPPPSTGSQHARHNVDKPPMKQDKSRHALLESIRNPGISLKPVTEGNIASGDGGESDMTVTVVDDQDLLKILASALISRREDIEEELDDDDDDELWQM